MKKKISSGLYQYKGYYVRKEKCRRLKNGGPGHTVAHSHNWSIYQLFDPAAKEEGFPEYLFHPVNETIPYDSLKQAMDAIDQLK